VETATKPARIGSFEGKCGGRRLVKMGNSVGFVELFKVRLTDPKAIVRMRVCLRRQKSVREATQMFNEHLMLDQIDL
jgi:hypothetical protein